MENFKKVKNYIVEHKVAIGILASALAVTTLVVALPAHKSRYPFGSEWDRDGNAISPIDTVRYITAEVK